MSPTNIGGQDFLAVPEVTGPSPEIYNVSGKVTGAVVAGVQIDLKGSQNLQTATDGMGNYSFSNVPSGTYVIVPSEANFTFDPLYRILTLA